MKPFKCTLAIDYVAIPLGQGQVFNMYLKRT